MFYIVKKTLFDSQDGKPLKLNDHVHKVSSRTIRVEKVSRRDRGMYQCMVANQEDTAQGSAQLKLGG